MRPFLTLTLLAAVAAFLLVPAAPASKPPPPGLMLVAESSTNNPVSPPWCLNEDDHHSRTWHGSLNGSFVVTEYFCTPGVDVYGGYDQWDGGGVGVSVNLVTVGTLTGLSLSNPGGIYNPAITVNGELVESTVIGHGGNAYVQNRYEACAFPMSQSQPFGPWTGTWTSTLSGNLSQVDYTVEAIMGYVPWVELRCPPSMR
jgi:hypothetical protein